MIVRSYLNSSTKQLFCGTAFNIGTVYPDPDLAIPKRIGSGTDPIPARILKKKYFTVKSDIFMKKKLVV